MKRLILVAFGAMALSGCMGTHIKPPPVCDGKHRRTANPNGSILPSLPVPQPASAAPRPDQPEVKAPTPEPVPLPAPSAVPGGDGVKPLSARDPAQFYSSC